MCRLFECAKSHSVSVVEHPFFEGMRYYLLPDLTLINPENYKVYRGDKPFDNNWNIVSVGDIRLETFGEDYD